jgi:phosphatidylserine decarboxylase
MGQDGSPQGDRQLDDVMGNFLAPVHRDGWKFILAALAAALLLFQLWSPLGWLALLLAGAIAYFFRDPPRVTQIREGLIVAPADGVVTGIKTLSPPAELGLGSEQRQRISIFLSVLDVHINRSPVSGVIAHTSHVPGVFVNAANADASEVNERRSTVIRMASGVEIAVVQIAGLIARRIVTFVAEGDSLTTGQRIGLIRFGSRVDVYLPIGKHALVSVGQTTIGGETVLADLDSTEPVRESRRG